MKLKCKSSQKSQADVQMVQTDKSIPHVQNTSLFHDPFSALKKNVTNLFNENVYTDDQFKLPEIKANKKISVVRLCSILQSGSSLFEKADIQRGLNDQISHGALPHFPNFVAQLHLLPIWHYQSLIEPSYVNERGFYHVVVWKDGRLVKETIDDTFYYDETFKTLYCEGVPETQSFKLKVWMHILLKVLVKGKGSYSNIYKASPFEFVRTFSYPDWFITNPAHQIRQRLITHLNPIQKKEIYAIAQTKTDPNIGLFGLVPDSVAYVISGHVMQYEAIFIKIKSLTGAKWNGRKSTLNIPSPQDQIILQENQFFIPIDEFLNLFHLIYTTSDKFTQRNNIYYSRYSLNLDARESKAKMIAFEILPPTNSDIQLERQIHPVLKSYHSQVYDDSNPPISSKQMEYDTNITIHFPGVRSYDLTTERFPSSQVSVIKNSAENSPTLKSNSKANINSSSNYNISHQSFGNQQEIIPYCKILFGMQSETGNLEASFVQSMKQKMLENQDGDFLCVKSNIQFTFKQGTFFKGYDNCLVMLMKLKPGKYYLRFKVQTLRVEYRANLNVVSMTQVKISDPKMDKKQELEFLKEILSSKARLQKRNLGYLNPIKKGSWFICNDDFSSLGYGYIVVQTRKSSDFKVQLKIDPVMLRQYGYRVKGKKDQIKYTITLMDGEGEIILLKLDENYDSAKDRVWPPPGIELVRLWAKQ